MRAHAAIYVNGLNGRLIGSYSFPSLMLDNCLLRLIATEIATRTNAQGKAIYDDKDDKVKNRAKKIKMVPDYRQEVWLSCCAD